MESHHPPPSAVCRVPTDCQYNPAMFSRRRLGSIFLLLFVILAIYGVDRLPVPSIERVVLMCIIGFFGANAVRRLWFRP